MVCLRAMAQGCEDVSPGFAFRCFLFVAFLKGLFRDLFIFSI